MLQVKGPFVFSMCCRQCQPRPTENTLCHSLSFLVVFFLTPPPLILSSPLISTCAINSSALLFSMVSISLWMFSLGKPGRHRQQYSLLFTPLPWERLSLPGPASSTLHHAANTMPCSDVKSQGLTLQAGNTC